MTSATNTTSCDRLGLRAPVLFLSLALVATLAAAGVSGPGFSKAFSPDLMGPGSVSMLTFTIDNSDSSLPAADVAFSDTLPSGMTLAAPAFVESTCDGTVTAPDAGSTISLADGKVGAFATCTVVVNVTAGAVDGADTVYTNTSGFLDSSLGVGGQATDELTVDIDLPGFSKSFAPSTVELGERSTLTFTIDNSLNPAAMASLAFTDSLPVGMEIASPANATTDCGTAVLPPTLVANPGTSLISFSHTGIAAFPTVAAGATCTVIVDVVATGIGLLGNVSGDLVWTDGAFAQNFIGKAAAVLTVTGVEDLLEISKEFVDDPVAPGGTTTLEFTVTNKSRDEAATSITFDDDLGAALPGLTASVPGTPDPPCGAGSALAFNLGVLTLTDGALPAEASCTFSVDVTVDPGSMPGSYLNTTGAVSGDVGGSPETGNTASDLLFVVAFPVLTKEFTDDPVAAGGTVTLEFTVTNSASSGMTDITFVDELTDNSGALPGAVGNGFLPFPVTVGLPPVPSPPCGGGSSLALVSLGTDRLGLELIGGSLAASGSCSFTVTITIPDDFPGGTYVNTTEPISATVGMATVVGPPASDTIVIAGAPTLTKEFTNDPVLPSGGPVTLVFTLSYDPELPADDATAIAFSDNLATVLAGLVAASVDSNTCAGSTVDITTDPTMIDFSGGTLTPGSSCVVSLTLTVPPGAPVGSFTNTTSDVTATVGGLATTNDGGQDALLVTPLVFTKEFLDDGEPAIPGETLTLRFSIQNLGAAPATISFFTDNLAAELAGLAATGPPSVDTCGGALSGTTFLIYVGGSVAGGTTCTIEVDVLVPPLAADGDYLNVTGSLATDLGTIPPARDVLSVSSTLVELTKEFTDDPVLPGSPVTLELTLTNLSAVDTVTDIAFDDDLTATLTGLEASSVDFNDCTGSTVDITTDPTKIDVSGGTLAPGAGCTIVVTLDVPPAPLAGSLFLNETSKAAGKVGTLDVVGSAASDTLEVQTITFTKSFDGPTTATGTAELSFTITNFDSANPVSGLAFSDDLEDVISGLTATLPPTPDPPCGAGSALAGTSFLALTGGSLAAAGSPGDSCTFAVTVDVPGTATAGTFVNTTSDLLQSGLPVADPATALLDIEPPPLFSKVFVPDTIFTDEVSKLTFTIDNTASALPATSLYFSDTLPFPVVVATPSMATTDCTGGTLTATDGGDTISYSGGEVAAGATCTIEVDVTSDTDGMFVNSSGDLTSSSGNSGDASDTLTVEPGEADLELVKEDAFEPVMAGGFQVYELTVTNTGPAVATGVTITDPVPAGALLVVAEPTAICSEMADIVTCAVGDLAVGESATVTIMVYVEPSEMPAPLDNMATVASDLDDPDLSDNDVLESTEVIPQAGLAMLDDVNSDGFPEAAVPVEGSIDVLVKDVESASLLHQTEVFPDGWVLTGFEKAVDDVAVMATDLMTELTEVRVIAGGSGAMVSTAAVPAGFLPITMTVIPDDGTGRTLVVTASISLTGGRGKVHAFDSSDGSPVSEFFLHPGAVPVAIAGVSSFVGDAVAELGIVWINTANGGKRLQVKELTGASAAIQNLPKSMFPVDVVGVPDCCGGGSDELAVLGWDQVIDRVRFQTREASGGLVVNGNFAIGAQPHRIRSLPTFGGSSAGELAISFRNFVPRAAFRVRDAMTGAGLGFEDEPPGSVPLGLDTSASVYGTAADEVSIYWVDPVGNRFVTVYDGAGGKEAKVPIP